MRIRTRLNTIVIAVAILVGHVPARAGNFAPSEKPNFTDIGRTLEAAPLENGELLYFDQMAADAAGLQFVPGRVGVPSFDQDVIKKLGWLIKPEPTVLDPLNKQTRVQKAKSFVIRIANSAIRKLTKGRFGSPYQAPSFATLEVEYDAHGGSGRAGLIKVVGENGTESWVNVKGIGLTGLGNTTGVKPGPPAKRRASHKDGSAYFIEGMAEAVGGRIASNDLKYGGSRVIALISTGMKITFPDGAVHSLLIIVRSPMRRYDRMIYRAHSDALRFESQKSIATSLGNAAARRIFKGDFVNYSNIGYGGEFIDYGKFSFVNGFVQGTNDEEAVMYRETARIFKDRIDLDVVYESSLAFYLLNQMGIEEGRLQRNLLESGDPLIHFQLQGFAKAFKELVYSQNHLADVVEQDKWDWKLAQGNLKLQFAFKEIVAALLRSEPNLKSDINLIKQIVRAYIETPEPQFEERLADFATILATLLRKATTDITDKVTYAAQVEKVAKFKNRDVWKISRPDMLSHFAKITEDYDADPAPKKIQKAVDALANESRLGTGAFTTSQLAVHADRVATYINVKAHVMNDGKHGPFAFPELEANAPGANQKFQISLDGKASSQEVSAKLIRTRTGSYYRISIPHGKFPVTDKMISLIPAQALEFANSNRAEFEIQGPPLFLNERLGLAADMQKVSSRHEKTYGLRVDSSPEDFIELEPAQTVRACKSLF